MSVVCAVILYQRAYELVRSRGAPGMTARLVPFTVDGLIWAASIVVLDASRPASRHHDWRRGAWVPVSWQRLVRIWHIGWRRRCADRTLPQ